MAIDSSKQEALEVDPKAIHQINFSEKFNQNTTMFSII